MAASEQAWTTGPEIVAEGVVHAEVTGVDEAGDWTEVIDMNTYFPNGGWPNQFQLTVTRTSGSDDTVDVEVQGSNYNNVNYYADLGAKVTSVASNYGVFVYGPIVNSNQCLCAPRYVRVVAADVGESGALTIRLTCVRV